MIFEQSGARIRRWRWQVHLQLCDALHVRYVTRGRAPSRCRRLREQRRCVYGRRYGNGQI